MKAFEHGKGVENVLNEWYDIVGNPMVIMGMQYNLLASTKNTVTDDYLWNELVIQGRFSHTTVNFFNTQQFVEDVANTEDVVVLKNENLKYDRICCKLFDKDDLQIGSIIMVACYRPIIEEDFKNIVQLCENISVEMQKSEFYLNTDSLLEETFISHRIEDKIIDEDFSEQMMNEIYKGLKSNLYLAVVDIMKYERTVTQLSYMRDMFKNLQLEFKYYIYLNNIVIVLSTDEKTLNINKDFLYLKEFFIENKIYAGISSSFENLSELKKHYRQALNALNYGMDSSDNENIFKYDNFRTDYFLNSTKNNVDLDNLYNPVLTVIKEHDEENKTFYFELIYNYLLFGKNNTMTCHKMKITEQELHIQLKQIENLFEIDWNNGNSLLSLFISFKILKQIQ